MADVAFLSLTPEAFKELRDMVVSWINEGFTTDPYSDAQYEIFEAFDIKQSEMGPAGYDISRPEKKP